MQTQKECCVIKDVYDCVHDCCQYQRGEITLKQYLDSRCDWHFDTNWGRFLPEDKRKKYHDLLVQDAIDRKLKDDRGLPDIDIIAAVHLGIWPR